MKKFAPSHEWIEVKAGSGVIGISAHAAKELGDVTYVELPDAGATLQVGDTLGSVESVKAASDIYAPVGCTVDEVNSPLEDEPELLNESPQDRGWLCKVSNIREQDLDSLMTEDAYKAFLGSDGAG